MDHVTTQPTALHYLELTQLAAHIRTRQISPVEVVQAQLDRIATMDGSLGSYALVTADIALSQAEAAEAEIATGRYRGPLHGIPIAVKDLFWTKGIPTAAGMPIHQDNHPTEDATVVRRLKEGGAVLLGKLQLTEGAYSDHHPLITAPKNPWNTDFWPGISSSGPGSATAAGLCYGALASDTGGSIRWPSAANGVTGLKPSWGRVSRHGVFELAASLDHVGPMARSAEDIATLLAAIAGGDPKDPTAITDPVPDYVAAVGQGIRGVRIGVDPEWNSADVDPAIQRALLDALEVFRSLGAQIAEVAFPDVQQAVADWYPICAVEAAVAHQATYPAHKSEYGPVLASVIEAGSALSGIDYQKLLLRRLTFRGSVCTFFNTVDLLLTPVHPFAPLSLDAIQTLGEQPELIARLQRYTCPFNLTGNPTITLPGGFTESGLPIGFQLVSAHLDEAMLLRAGAAFQSATSWHRCHPLA
ncbi:amidase [Stutzerimonas stutzeri]|uniref:Amidase n=1 Tax=Stutzerimonas stutzeri TaxID=316 RepID=A0A0D9AM80_STUST|nr:amidase [Stutzerimonas stutzeri]KJH82165.1 amidase [Stutzerimonas stutzeri]